MWRLALFDALLSLRGFKAIYRDLGRHRAPRGSGEVELENAVCEAVTEVSSFYWKPVRCLQRSSTIASVLRIYGIDAQVVVGFKPAPLFSHAWVEVEGRVVDGSAAYRRKLFPLARI
jgi:hypothetical protein